MLASAFLLAAAVAPAADAVGADAAVTALVDFCLTADSEFRDAPALLRQAGWVDINEQARGLPEGRALIPIWRPRAGGIALISGVKLRSVAEEHTSCLIASSRLTLSELRSAATDRLGPPDATGEGTHWSVPGQPNRYVMLSQNLAGQRNNGLVVVELRTEG